MQRSPASITSHLELSTMMGMRAMSGSDAMSCRNRTMAACCRDGLVHVDVDDLRRSPAGAPRPVLLHWPFRIMRAKRLGAGDVVVRSPMLTKQRALANGDRLQAGQLHGGRDGADVDIGPTCAGAAEKQVSVVAVGLE